MQKNTAANKSKNAHARESSLALWSNGAEAPTTWQHCCEPTLAVQTPSDNCCMSLCCTRLVDCTATHSYGSKQPCTGSIISRNAQKDSNPKIKVSVTPAE